MTGRPLVRSPGRPAASRREALVSFWEAIAEGVSTVEASGLVGVSQAVGVRWFRKGGGMPTVTLAPLSGRYLRFEEREEGGLLHFGYTPDAIAHRLARRERVFFAKDGDEGAELPEGLPVAELAEASAGSLPLAEDEAEAVREAYEAFPKRTKYVLTVRLGLGGEQKHVLREVGDALGLHLSRVQQLPVYATDLLVEAVGEPKHARAGLRADVIETLQALAITQ